MYIVSILLIVYMPAVLSLVRSSGIINYGSGEYVSTQFFKRLWI